MSLCTSPLLYISGPYYNAVNEEKLCQWALYYTTSFIAYTPTSLYSFSGSEQVRLFFSLSLLSLSLVNRSDLLTISSPHYHCYYYYLLCTPSHSSFIDNVHESFFLHLLTTQSSALLLLL